MSDDVVMSPDDDIDAVKWEFGRWLANLREEVGYRSQQDAADAAKISRTSLARYETGVTFPNRETIPKLAVMLKGRASEAEIMRRIGMGPLPQKDSEDRIITLPSSGGMSVTDGQGRPAELPSDLGARILEDIARFSQQFQQQMQQQMEEIQRLREAVEKQDN